MADVGEALSLLFDISEWGVLPTHLCVCDLRLCLTCLLNLLVTLYL